PRCEQDVPGPEQVRRHDSFRRRVVAGLSGEMADGVTAASSPPERVEVEQVGAVLEIEADHEVPAGFELALDDGPDLAFVARDEDSHPSVLPGGTRKRPGARLRRRGSALPRSR